MSKVSRQGQSFYYTALSAEKPPVESTKIVLVVFGGVLANLIKLDQRGLFRAVFDEER